METTDYQENKEQQQEPFDLETKRKIQESLQEIYNKQQQQQATKSNGGGVEKQIFSNLYMTENLSAFHSRGSFKRSKYHTRIL
jgi:hypothetical protein